jgi:predicted RNase H-like HicB family nuclease
VLSLSKQRSHNAPPSLYPDDENTRMRDYHINIFYSEEDGGYIADIPDLDTCSAFGSTPEQALAEVEKAKQAWLEAARAEGKPIPPRRPGARGETRDRRRCAPRR